MSSTDKLILRTSDRGLFRACRQKWDFSSKVRMGYRPNRTANYFEFGSAIHAGLQAYYDPGFWDHTTTEGKVVAAVGAFLQTHKEQLKRAKKSYAATGMPEHVKEDYDEREEQGVGMLQHYGQWAPFNDNFRPLYTEIEFEVPVLTPDGGQLYINRTPVYYQGRIDLILQEIATKRQLVLDHKTAARFDSIEHVDVDTQISSYVWAGQQLGIKLDGFIYSELKKSVPSPPTVLQRPYKGRMLSTNKQQATTRPMFEKAIKEQGENPALYEEYLAFLDTQGMDDYFRRHEVHRTPAEIKFTERKIYEEARDMFEGIDGDGPSIYPNPSKWNCRGCAFKTPCLLVQEGGDFKYVLENEALYYKQ